MDELESLLLVVLAIYLTESAFWIRRGVVAYVAWWGKLFRPWHPGPLLGNRHGSLTLANPLPPLGTVFVAGQPSISLSPEAAYSYSAACPNPVGRPLQIAKYLRYENFGTVEVEGKKVMVNGDLFYKANSPFSARHIGAGLKRLQKPPAAERAPMIRAMLTDSLDTQKIRERINALRQQAKWIRPLCNGLFVYLFLIIPVWVYHFGLKSLGWILFGALLAQTITIAVLFRRAHKKLYPAGGEERFTPFLTMLLAPPAAIRAFDILALPLLNNFHPLAAAAVLCPPAIFKRVARQAVLDLRFPLLPVCPTGEIGPVDTEEWFRKTSSESIEAFLTRSGMDLEELTRPPEPSEPGNRSYCPRCGSQFTMPEGVCRDCGDRPLQPFA